MEEMTTAQKLIKGSAELDRMKSEIELLAGIVIGSLAKIRAELPERKEKFGREGLRFKVGENDWIVGRISETSKPFLELEIRPWDGVQTVYYSEWTDTSVSAKFVRYIHTTIARLVDCLIDEFPELKQVWYPLIKASE